MAGSVGSDDGRRWFQIAPMVDVVFVLMLFFMACAGSQIVERALNINSALRRCRLPTPSINPPCIIEISSDGVVSMNNTVYVAAPSDKNLTNLSATVLKNATETFGNNDPSDHPTQSRCETRADHRRAQRRRCRQGAKPVRLADLRRRAGCALYSYEIFPPPPGRTLTTAFKSRRMVDVVFPCSYAILHGVRRVPGEGA
jgi:biopolymer transport protein ExbD